MKLKIDMKNYKSGEFINKYGYKCFKPNSINRQWTIDNPEIILLLEEANLKLGELNAFSLFVPDMDLFTKMHILKEATQSSRIEGIHTSMDEAILEAKDIDPKSREDWQEVQNYIEALNHSIANLDKIPLSARLIKEAHKILLAGVGGTNKSPGEFRKSQNWIGGETIKDAVFVPPPHSLVLDCIGDLEKFLNNEKLQIPHLIRIGIAHYQFEAIHPFLDGNGRIGRLLITLYLINKKVLNKPTLYLSDFIEKNRQYYYANLMNVSLYNSIDKWLKYFLIGVIQTAKKAIDTLTKLIELRNKLEKDVIISLGKKLPRAKALLHYLYSKPLVKVSELVINLKTTKQTVNSLVKDFENLGILKKQTRYKRNRIFLFQEYLNLFRKG